jgi:hypothetical protein
MKLIKSMVLTCAVALGAILVTGATAHAQNQDHAPSDLVLHFQNPGGSVGSSQTMIIALGNVSTFFRSGAPNTYTNLINIGSQLSTTFGSTWYEQTTLWAGAVGFRGTSDTLPNLYDLDPNRTIYATAKRDSVGTVGAANSTAPSITNDATMTSTVNSINGVKGNLEALQPDNAVGVFPTSSSFVDDRNPFLGANQSTAYTGFPNGVQDNFFVGNLGSFGTAGTVELALDLYRLQARNDISGQYGFGDPVRQGQFLGTITIDQTGQVGFTSIPEPSTWALIALGCAGLIGYRIRRKA